MPRLITYFSPVFVTPSSHKKHEQKRENRKEDAIVKRKDAELFLHLEILLVIGRKVGAHLKKRETKGNVLELRLLYPTVENDQIQ